MNDETETTDNLAGSLDNRLFFRLYQCANMLHKTGTRALEEHRVTTQQWAIIGALSRPGTETGMTVGELAAFLLVSRQNLAGMLSRMEMNGLVDRAVDTRDSRSRRIRLTETGRSLWLEELRPKIAGYYEEALRGFSTEDRIHFTHYLAKLLDSFRRLDADEAR